MSTRQKLMKKGDKDAAFRNNSIVHFSLRCVVRKHIRFDSNLALEPCTIMTGCLEFVTKTFTHCMNFDIVTRSMFDCPSEYKNDALGNGFDGHIVDFSLELYHYKIKDTNF